MKPRDVLALALLLGQLIATFWIVPAWSPWVPTQLAAIGSVATTLAILALQLRGIRGSKLERALLVAFLGAMPLVYLASWAVQPTSGWLVFELVGLLVFGAMAWAGARGSVVWLGLGIVAHGLAWDAWHHDSGFVPTWYVLGCLLVDVGLGGYVLLQAPHFGRVQAVAR